MSPGAETTAEGHDIIVHLDELLADRGMTLTELAERVGVTIANLSILKNGRATAMRFTTLTAICRELRCQPGDLPATRPPTTSPPHDHELLWPRPPGLPDPSDAGRTGQRHRRRQ
jgi:putative transcriptional regulator